MDLSDPNFLMALFLLACSGVGTAVALVWKLTRVEQALREAIAASRDELEAKWAAEQRIYNETLLAIRQKINDVELDAAKTYMRREGFYSVQTQFREDLKSLAEKFEDRFNRMEEKIDLIRK